MTHKRQVARPPPVSPLRPGGGGKPSSRYLPARGPASGWGAPSPPRPRSRRQSPPARSQGAIRAGLANWPERLGGRQEGHARDPGARRSSLGAPSPGTLFPLEPSPDLGPAERAAGVPRGPHQAELANFVVGHEAEDVLDGYDGQRHQRVVLRQLVRSQRRGWGHLGSRLRELGRGRWGQSLGAADSRRGAAVAVAAASFLSHPLLRRRRHLWGLSPSPTARGNRDTSGASLPPLERQGRGTWRRGRSLRVTGGDGRCCLFKWKGEI